MPPPQDKAEEAYPRASHDPMDEKQAVGETRDVEVSAASVALAAAMAEQKPKMFSRDMWKLWWIMGIGYLVSTMNGYGTDTLFSIPLFSAVLLTSMT